MHHQPLRELTLRQRPHRRCCCRSRSRSRSRSSRSGAKTASASALIAAVPHSRKIRGRAATDAIENKGDIRSIVVPELPQPGHAAVPLCVELIALEQVVVQCARRGPHVVHRSDAMEPHPALEAAEPAFDYAERALGGGGGMGQGGR